MRIWNVFLILFISISFTIPGFAQEGGEDPFATSSPTADEPPTTNQPQKTKKLLHKFLPDPPVDEDSFGSVVLDAQGDLNDDGVPDYLIGNNEDVLFIKTPIDGQETILQKSLSVNYDNLTTDCSVGNMSTFERVGDISGSGRPHFVVADQTASITDNRVFPPIINNIGMACVYSYDKDNNSLDYVTHILGFAPYDRFGACVQGVGDINDNGFDDFIVCAPNSERRPLNNGGFAFMSGSINLIDGLDAVTFANNRGFVRVAAQFTGLHLGAEFGSSIDLIGKLHDYTYVAVGGMSEARGACPLFTPHRGGSISFIAARLTDTLPRALTLVRHGEVISPNCDEGYGASVAVIKTPSDEHLMFVGAPLANNNTGKVYVYKLIYSGLPERRINAVLVDVIDGVKADSGFGWSMRGVGDFNGDGVEDVGISAPRFRWSGGTKTGKVYIYSGIDHSLLTTIAYHGFPYFDVGGNNIFDGGTDMSGDARDDLILGVPQHDSQKGKAQIYGR